MTKPAVEGDASCSRGVWIYVWMSVSMQVRMYVSRPKAGCLGQLMIGWCCERWAVLDKVDSRPQEIGNDTLLAPHGSLSVR